jgi:hypothetical protein
MAKRFEAANHLCTPSEANAVPSGVGLYSGSKIENTLELEITQLEIFFERV